jgi:Tol biopolymer transport system component
MTWIDRQGNRISEVGAPDYFISPRISRDGSQLVLQKYALAGPGGVIVYDFARGLVMEPGHGGYPLWSSDGRSIIYMEGNSILRKDPDSRQPASVLAKTEGGLTSLFDVSPDERFVAFSDSRGLVGVSTVAGQAPVVFGAGQAPRFSPDGRWIAYVDVERVGIYVQKFPESTSRVLVSNDGTGPVWRRDGKELFYRAANGRLMAVDVRESAGSITFGAPRELFAFAGQGLSAGASYDVSPDGKAFLVLIPNESGRSENELTLLINWREGLKK